MYGIALTLWAVFLVAAVFYTRHERHPGQPPLAAFLIFTTVFTVVSFGIFAAAVVLFGFLGKEWLLGDPLIAVALLTAMTVPAFLLARGQLRKAPRSMRP